MNVKNIQELEDRTLIFEGSLNPTEVAVVVSMGLNTMLAMGLMEMIPGIESKEIFNMGGDDDASVQ